MFTALMIGTPVFDLLNGHWPWPRKGFALGIGAVLGLLG